MPTDPIVADESQQQVYERTTGRCAECGGHGEQTIFCSGFCLGGHGTEPCARCGGTGQAPSRFDLDLQRAVSALGFGGAS